MHNISLLQFIRLSLTIIALLCLAHPARSAEINQPPARKYSNVERLALPRLKAVHEDVLKLRATARASSLPCPA